MTMQTHVFHEYLLACSYGSSIKYLSPKRNLKSLDTVSFNMCYCRKNGSYLNYTRMHSTAAVDDWHDDDMGGRVVLFSLNAGDTLGRPDQTKPSTSFNNLCDYLVYKI